MKFTADIEIMPLKDLLDPQGKTVAKNLGQVGITGVSDVRIGKNVHLTLEAESQDAARKLVEQACEKLLVNRVVESYSYALVEAVEN